MSHYYVACAFTSLFQKEERTSTLKGCGGLWNPAKGSMNHRSLSLLLASLVSPALLFGGNRYQIEREYLVKNKSPDKEMRIKLNLPGLAPYINSKILSATFTPEPPKVTQLHPGVEKLEYDLTLASDSELPVKMVWVVELESTDATAVPVETLPPDKRARYLAPAKLIESTHPKIMGLAKEIRAQTSDDRAFVDSVFQTVKQRLKPQGFGTVNRGALFALQNGTGDCTEYAALMVALLRAGGLPARINTAMSMQKDGISHYDNHNNAEVYLGDRWLPLEPFFGVKEVGRLTNTEIIMRIGLPNGPMQWASWSTANSFKKYKEVKLIGHRWQRLN